MDFLNLKNQSELLGKIMQSHTLHSMKNQPYNIQRNIAIYHKLNAAVKRFLSSLATVTWRWQCML